MILNLITVVSNEFDVEYIKHFIKHYSQYDIDNWHVVINDPSGKDRNEAYFRFKTFKPDCKFYFWTEEFSSPSKVKYVNDIISKCKGYILFSDIDELQQWTEEPKIAIKKHHIVGGTKRDRFDWEFKPREVDQYQSIYEQFPIKSDVSKEQLGSYTHLPCAFHSSYRLENNHDLIFYGRLVEYKSYIDIDHFKWNLKRKYKAQKRVEVHKLKGGNYAESEKLLSMFYSD